jgi:hypothetical protein
MQTIALTPAVLAALAEGVDRLERGDPKMNEQAREVRKMMAVDNGLVLSRFEWFPAADVTSGYVKPGVYASKAIADRLWNVDGYDQPQELAPGQQIFLDFDCTVPLRTL